GLEIPIVAWVDDGPGNARRVNGNIIANAFPSSPLPLRRGVGHTLLPAANAGGGALVYDGHISSLTSAKPIQIDAVTTWQTVSGDIPQNTVWPENSRVHVTGDITIAD